jgi:opacity protein-like surface antigen
MKKRIGKLLLSICLLMSLSGIAAADDTKGIYVGVVGGYVVPLDLGTTGTTAGHIITDIALDKGYLFGLKAGYLTPFTNKIFAVEVEYNHIRNNFDTSKTYSFGQYCIDSKIRIDALMFNFLGRYPNGGLHPYAGLGIGYANIQISDIVVKSSGSGARLTTYSGATKGAMAGQLLAGIDFDVTKNMIVGLGYKYIVADKISYTSTATDYKNAAATRTVDAEYKSHNFVLSVSYLF